SYLAIRRQLAARADSPDRAGLERQSAELRAALLSAAGRGSRLFVSLERRPDYDGAAEVRLARLVARDGRVTIEAMSGARPQSPAWERAGEIAPDAYVALVGRLLDDPTVTAGLPRPIFDPNAPGPRKAATLRLAIGDEEWALEALTGVPFERLSAVVAAVLEFCRIIPVLP
ncbi:MAG TPA: hypothetical protein VFO18_06605, partial [Methylomirabilota bacterium]|nr:hypothetical protein [Methylomirabilota bacterium]